MVRPNHAIHVLYLGMVNFPCGLAETQKARLLSQGLMNEGWYVTVLNRWGGNNEDAANPPLQPKGVYEGVEYVFASGSPYRPQSSIRRKLLKLKGLFCEARTIYGFHRRGQTLAAIISGRMFWNIMYYRMLSTLLGFPIVFLDAEVQSAILRHPRLLDRVNAYLFDRYAYRWVDGILPISDYLVSRIKQLGGGTPWLKVPVLVDTHRFDKVKKLQSDAYFLFCGALVYIEVIEFILESFDRCIFPGDVQLYLVVNGSSREFEDLAAKISGIRKSECVKVYSRLSDAELSELYLNAYALLIPLRPTVQDLARFPHKIGEYCASGRPVVTTNYGEIRSYFINQKNAVVAQKYDVEEYARAMEYALQDPERAADIGHNGKQLALREFDHLVQGRRIKAFIESLLKFKGVELRHDQPGIGV